MGGRGCFLLQQRRRVHTVDAALSPRYMNLQGARDMLPATVGGATEVIRCCCYRSMAFLLGQDAVAGGATKVGLSLSPVDGDAASGKRRCYQQCYERLAVMLP